MNVQSQRERLRWKRKPFPELGRLAWPIAVSTLSYSIMTLIDALFVGRLGASALAAVGLGGITTFTVLCFGLGLLRGGKIAIAQALGAGERERVPRLAGAALVCAVAFGLLAAAMTQVAAAVMPWLAVEAESGALAGDYVSVRGLAAPVPLAAAALREVRYALGDSRTPMRAALVANAVNIPLNALFIFGLDLGVLGAALATVVAQAFELAALWLAQREAGRGLGAWRRHDVLALWRLGAPVGLERLLDVGSFTLMVGLFARMSTTDLAAHHIAVQIVHFAFLPTFAVGEAASVLSGQAVGAHEDEVVPKVARGALGLAGGVTLSCSALFLAFGPSLVGVFGATGSVSTAALGLLHVSALFLPFHALYCVAQGVLRGSGDVRFAAIVAVVTAWVSTPLLAAVLGLGLGWGALGGWVGLSVEIIAGSLILSGRYRSGAWRRAAAISRAALDDRREPAEETAPAGAFSGARLRSRSARGPDR